MGKKLLPILPSVGLVSLRFQIVEEWVMNQIPLDSLNLVNAILIIFLGLSFLPWAKGYVEVKGGKWLQVIGMYLLPIFLISTAISFYMYDNWYSRKTIAQILDEKMTPGNELNRIVGRKFENQTVYIDGNKYVDCDFDHVTFVAEGDNFGFEQCSIGEGALRGGNNKLVKLILQMMGRLYKMDLEARAKETL